MFRFVIARIAAHIPENNRIERIWKLAQVDFRSRYYNDRLGLIWALIRPIFEVCLYYFVFTMLFKSTIENYALFLFSGLIFWMFFAETTSRGMNLFQTKLYLIENIQFQRLDLFISFALSTFIALLFNFGAYSIFSFISGVYFSVDLFLIVLPFVSLMAITMGLMLILASTKPFLKDLQHLWDMILMAGFWVSGIFFDAKVLSESGYGWVAEINPLIGIFHNIHACLIPGVIWDGRLMIVSLIYSLLILLIGYWVFKKYGYIAVEKL